MKRKAPTLDACEDEHPAKSTPSDVPLLEQKLFGSRPDLYYHWRWPKFRVILEALDVLPYDLVHVVVQYLLDYNPGADSILAIYTEALRCSGELRFGVQTLVSETANSYVYGRFNEHSGLDLMSAHLYHNGLEAQILIKSSLGINLDPRILSSLVLTQEGWKVSCALQTANRSEGTALECAQWLIPFEGKLTVPDSDDSTLLKRFTFDRLGNGCSESMRIETFGQWNQQCLSDRLWLEHGVNDTYFEAITGRRVVYRHFGLPICAMDPDGCISLSSESTLHIRRRKIGNEILNVYFEYAVMYSPMDGFASPCTTCDSEHKVALCPVRRCHIAFSGNANSSNFHGQYFEIRVDRDWYTGSDAPFLYEHLHKPIEDMNLPWYPKLKQFAEDFWHDQDECGKSKRFEALFG
jgi:hypothetical protein